VKHIFVIDLGEGESTQPLSFLGQSVELRRVGCGGDVAVARELIAREDGRADVIALDGLPARVRLGPVSRPHHHTTEPDRAGGCQRSGSSDSRFEIT